MVVDDVIKLFRTPVPAEELAFEARLDLRALSQIDMGYPAYEIFSAQDKEEDTQLEGIAIGAEILGKIHQGYVGSPRARQFDMMLVNLRRSQRSAPPRSCSK